MTSINQSEVVQIPERLLFSDFTEHQQEKMYNESRNPNIDMYALMELERKRIPLQMLISQYRLRNANFTLFIEEAYRNLINEPLFSNYYHPIVGKGAEKFSLNDVKVKFKVRVAYDDNFGFGEFALIDTKENGIMLLDEAYRGSKREAMIEILTLKLTRKEGNKTINCSSFLSKKIENIRNRKEVVKRDEL